MHLIWTKIVTTFSARAYGTAIELISLLITARVLGPDGRGTVASIIAWTALFAAVFGLSLSQVIVYRFTNNVSNSQFNRTFSALIPLSFFLCLAGWLCALVIYTQTESGGLKQLPTGVVVLGFTLLPFIMWESYSSHLLSTTGRLNQYNMGLVIGKTLGFTTMLVVIFLAGLGVYGPIIGNLAALIITILIAILTMRESLSKPLCVYASEVVSLVSGGLKLHINTIGSFLLLTVDIVILSQYRSMEEVGWYQAATQLIAVPLMLPGVVTMVLYSKVADEGPVKVWTIHRRLIQQIMVVIGVVAVVSYFIAPNLVYLLLGSEFTETIPVFRILLLAMIGMCFSQLMVAQWIGRGLFLQAGIITIVAGLTNVILNFYFIPTFGMYAAAWTTVGAFIISIITNGIFAMMIEREWKYTYS